MKFGFISILLVFTSILLLATSCSNDPYYYVPELKPTTESSVMVEPINGEIIQAAIDSASVNSQKIVTVDENTQGLYSVNPDGSDLQLLAIFNTEELVDAEWYAIQYPVVSPDGHFVLFMLYVSQGSRAYVDLYVVNIDGTGLKKLENNISLYDMSYLNGAWSPDSKHVVIQVGGGTHSEVYIIDILNGDMHLLANQADGNEGPTWSSDGEKIAYNHMNLAADGSNWEYYINIINPDGSDLKQVTMDPTQSLKMLVWSPDGKQLAYANRDNRNIGSNTIITFDDQMNVIGTRSYACDIPYGFIVWSSDGKYLGAACDWGGKPNIVILDTLDPYSSPNVIGEGYSPSFSPDGKFLLYTHSNDSGVRKVILADLSSGKSEELFLSTNQITLGYEVTWAPSTFDNRSTGLDSIPPVNHQGKTYCNNPYWPIIQGAWWKYYLPGHTQSSPNHTWVDSIDSISQTSDFTYFTIKSVDEDSGSTSYRTYSCDIAGGILNENGIEILPPESLITEGYRWMIPDGIVMATHFWTFSEPRTTLGILDVVQFTYEGQMHWDFYAKGIGPYGWGDGATGADLLDYYLPAKASNDNECNHPYWPVKQGYEWHYHTIEMGNSFYWWTVKEVGVDELNRSYFTILQLKSYPYPDEEITYYCHDNGIYDQNNRLVLPPIEQMNETKIFGNSMDDMTKFVGFAQLPFKNVDYDVVLMQIPNDTADTEWVWAFAKGLGLIKKYNYTTDLGRMDLSEASLIEK